MATDKERQMLFKNKGKDSEVRYYWYSRCTVLQRRKFCCNMYLIFGRWSKIGYRDLSNMTYLSRLTMMFLRA